MVSLAYLWGSGTRDPHNQRRGGLDEGGRKLGSFLLLLDLEAELPSPPSPWLQLQDVGWRQERTVGGGEASSPELQRHKQVPEEASARLLTRGYPKATGGPGTHIDISSALQVHAVFLSSSWL